MTKIVLALGLLLTVSINAGAAQSVQVVDGDTLIVDGLIYRLDGIDAPETGQTCVMPDGSMWDCGAKAARALIDLTHGKAVTCDNRGLGDYHRTLAVCFANGVELNLAMVQRGLAWSFQRTTMSDYSNAQTDARTDAVGIWAAPNLTPTEFQQTAWEKAKQSTGAVCPIKARPYKGTNFYFTPWALEYEDVTRANGDGDMWFCAEATAIRAGWRVPNWGEWRP